MKTEPLRQVGGEGHLLCLQRTQVWFQTLISTRLQMPGTPGQRVRPLVAFMGTCTHIKNIQINRHTYITNLKFLKILKCKGQNQKKPQNVFNVLSHLRNAYLDSLKNTPHPKDIGYH